jgi:hypothetical protein
MILFRKSKIQKVKKDLRNNVKIVIPSAAVFFDCYKINIHKMSAKIDSNKPLDKDESTRVQHLMSNFTDIASEALIETLIEVGYKREDKNKWMKSWF